MAVGVVHNNAGCALPCMALRYNAGEVFGERSERGDNLLDDLWG